jgi:cytochrome bd ubiquinol oxidase subunit I
VLFNKVQLATFPHVMMAAYMTGAAFVVGVSFWGMLRDQDRGDDHQTFRHGVRTGATVLLVAGLGVAFTGDVSGKVMTDVQPMKMAAAEALYDTQSCAPFSVLTVGNLNGSQHTDVIQIPCLLSFLGTGHFNGTIRGIDDLRAEYKATYGQDPGQPYYSPGDYTPIIPVTYWTFRLMIGLGLLTAAAALLILFATRKGRAPTSRWWVRLGILLPLLPVAANSFGWIFTEMGRQPWVVFGLMTTANGVSPTVGAGLVATSLITFTLLYLVLAVIEVGLILKTIRQGLPDVTPPAPSDGDDADSPLAFAY